LKASVQQLNVVAPCQVSDSNWVNIGFCRMIYQNCWSAASLTAVENSRQLYWLLAFLALGTQKSALCNQRTFISLEQIVVLQLTWLLFRNNFLLDFTFRVYSKIKNSMLRGRNRFPFSDKKSNTQKVSLANWQVNFPQIHSRITWIAIVILRVIVTFLLC